MLIIICIFILYCFEDNIMLMTSSETLNSSAGKNNLIHKNETKDVFDTPFDTHFFPGFNER